MKGKKVIIVGSGIGGLTAGHWLQKKGYQVELFEALDRSGGRIALLERENGDRVDAGAEFFHSNYSHVFKLIKEFGLTSSLRKADGKSIFKFSDGTQTEFSDNTIYSKGLSILDHLKLGWFVCKYIILSKRAKLFNIQENRPEWDQISLADLFNKPGDKKVKELLIGIAKTGNNCEPEWISLFHLIQLIRIVMFTRFSVLRGGTASLSNAIADTLNITYNTPVKSVVMRSGKVTGVELPDGRIEEADHVIVATTPFAAKKLLPTQLSEQKAFFESIPQTPLPKPFFFLNRPLNKEVWSYFNKPGEARLFGFAVDEAMKCPDMVPSGNSVLRAYACYPRSLELKDYSDEKILELALKDLEDMIPGVSEWVEESKVFWHYRGGLAHYPVGAYGKIVEFKEKAKQLKGISFVSDYFGGSYIEGAMESANDAVKRICQLQAS